MSIDDYVTVNEGKDSVTITATIDPELVKKEGKDIHYVATNLVNSIYNNSTSTGFFDSLLGNEYNTRETKSEPGKGIIQTGQIKYNSFWDGILRPAEKTDYEIVVNETDGTVSVKFTNEGHGAYAKRAAEDALGAIRNYHCYFVSYKAEKKDPAAKEGEGTTPETPKSGTREDLEGIVEGDPKGAPPKADAEMDKNSEAYKGTKDAYVNLWKNQYAQLGELLKDPDASFEKLIKANPQELKNYEEAMKAKAKAEAEKAAEEEEKKKKEAAENK
jgi:hypothetical protein